MRIHGHRAARIDPLDLIHREEVPALSPSRYGLGEGPEGEKEKYNVDGIVWTRGVGQGEGAELWTLEDIVKSLRGVYVGRIGYEVLVLLLLPTAQANPPTVYALDFKDRASLVLPFTRVSDTSQPRRLPHGNK